MAVATASPPLGNLCASPARVRYSCIQRRAAARVSLPCAFITSDVHAADSSSVFSTGRDALDVVTRPMERQRRGDLVVRGLFGLGVPELAVIAGVAALVFGPKQLPQIGKSLGKTVKSFQQAAKEFESEISGAAKEGQAEVGTKKSQTSIEEPQKSETITSTPIATTSTKSEKETS